MLQLEVHDSDHEPQVVRDGDAVTVHFPVGADLREIPGLTSAERDLAVALWTDDSAARTMVPTDAGTLIIQPRQPMDDLI
jgi:hypothetical protein